MSAELHIHLHDGRVRVDKTAKVRNVLELNASSNNSSRNMKMKLTWHAASCNFPNFGRINGAIWLHRNVCTEPGTPRSCSPSSYASRLSLL